MGEVVVALENWNGEVCLITCNISVRGDASSILVLHQTRYPNPTQPFPIPLHCFLPFFSTPPLPGLVSAPLPSSPSETQPLTLISPSPLSPHFPLPHLLVPYLISLFPTSSSCSLPHLSVPCIFFPNSSLLTPSLPFPLPRPAPTYSPRN